MSGLLDNKSRIIDAFLTQEGRKQIAQGDLRVRYVSYTDNGTYYAADLQSGSRDASTRLFLENCSLPQDQVTFEADDSGNLRPFRNESGLQVQDGQIVSYSFQSTTGSIVEGSSDGLEILKGAEFASSSETLLSSSLENFKKLRILSSKDYLFEDDGFKLGPSFVKFVITDSRPIPDRGAWLAHIDHVESLFNDPRLSRVDNFKYLPPINKIDDDKIDKSDPSQTSKYRLGNYVPWGRVQTQPLEFDQIKHELQYYSDLGYSKTISFDPTSRDNHLVIQMFEQGYDRLRKLDVIDYGQHVTGDPSAPLAHVFFLGRIFEDDNGTHTFVHLFTMVFE